jgi:hypothetical protein
MGLQSNARKTQEGEGMKVFTTVLVIALVVQSVWTVKLRGERDIMTRERDALRVEAAKHTVKQFEPILMNSCFHSRSSLQQVQLLGEIDKLSDTEFKSTLADFDAMNAGDRLLGTTGCRR